MVMGIPTETGVQTARLDGGSLMLGNTVIATSTREAAIMQTMKRLAEYFPGDVDMERRVRALLRDIPAVLSVEKITDAESIIASHYPDWSRSQTHNVAILVYKRGCDSRQKQLPGVYLQSYTTCLEKGECAKASPLDTSLPEASRADKIWKDPEWDQCLCNADQLVARLVQPRNFDGCKFDLVSASCAEQLCVSLTPCVILKFRGHPLSHLSTGALIKLHVENDIGSYDDSKYVGELILEGEAFLRNCGPERHSIALGITDMKMIQWFRIFHSKEDGHLMVAKSLATTAVRESICGFLHAEPSVLGVKMNLAIHQLPSSWRVVKHLGSGLTSHVYLVISGSSRLAVKVPQLGFDLLDDIKYLEALVGVDGVPRIHQKVHSMIALEPVCELFSAAALDDYEAKRCRLSLADLVVVLECAHQRGIVNRDLRPENIMIGESLYNAGRARLYILDWGFATKSDEVSPFSGSVVTASDHVLEQLSQQKNCALTRIVVSTNDDLVSLVRCLFLAFHFSVSFTLQQIRKEPEMLLAFWKNQMECNLFWRKAEDDARHLQYDSLKYMLSDIPRT